MTILRHIVCFFQVLLFALFAMSLAFANAGNWQKAECPTYHPDVAFQHADLAFAARAPPSASENVAIIGGTKVVGFVVPAGAATRIARATPDVAPNRRELPETVYRGDGRGPDEIFEEGFQPRDPNADVDLETYVQSTPSPDSQYVSTTSDPDVATDFATQYGTQPCYVYDIETPPNGIDVDATLGSGAIYDEAEIAIPDGTGISGCGIRGCQPVNPDGTPSGPYVPNPGYTGGN